MTEYIEIENPCYHCYIGATGQCSLTGCKYKLKPWSQDVEHETIEILKEVINRDVIELNDINKILDSHLGGVEHGENSN